MSRMGEMLELLGDTFNKETTPMDVVVTRGAVLFFWLKTETGVSCDFSHNCGGFMLITIHKMTLPFFAVWT